MKRKSERRRGEARKKRCAARNGSQAAPHRDIYIAITGKRVCGMNPVNPKPGRQTRADALCTLCTRRAAFLHHQVVRKCLIVFCSLI